MVLCGCSVLWLAGLGVLAWLAYKKYRNVPNSGMRPLNEPNYKKDLVYLVQPNAAPTIRSTSPFALKLETWLRLTGIPYETRYSLRPNARGQTPFIEYNGWQYPDTDLIIKFLTKEKDVSPDKGIEGGAMAHATRVMLEQHTTAIGFYRRYSLHCDEVMQKTVYMDAVPFGFVPILRRLLPMVVRLRFHLQGISRHTEEDIIRFSFDDLRAISTFLGEKKFYLGDDKPTSIDCTIFGHLAQFLYFPIDFPQKAFMKEECPNLAAYMDRMRDRLWPDWKEMCQQSCMTGKKGLSLM